MTDPSKRLTHLDDAQRPRMVDVSGKEMTLRTARASCTVRLPPDVASAIAGDELVSAKGPVFQTAILAGVMAAKKTSELIPFCHPIGLDDCDVTISLTDEHHVYIEAIARVWHKTGVEMEALTAVSIAALTLYDMCKALSHDIVISDIQLLDKTGGKKDVHRTQSTSE